MTSNCLVWHPIIRSKIKSALHNTFEAAKSRENNTTTQTTSPDQQRQNNQHMWAVAFERSTTNSSHQNKFYAWIDFKQVGGSASSLLYSTSDKHNTLELKINSRFAHNLSFYLPFSLLLLYRKSSIVASTTNLVGFEWMIDRLRKQEQIGKATCQFTFHSTTTCKERNNPSSKLKPTTLTFCSCKSFACLPDSFLPWLTVPSCPRPTVKQSKFQV